MIPNRLTLVAATVAAALIGAGAVAVYDHAGPGSDRARMESVVHDYVLANPEIIPQAMQLLQDRQTGAIIAANKSAIVTPSGSAWAGNPNGDVTLVEYYDYNCGFCRASLPTIAKLIASDPKLKVVYHDFPILSDESGVAARLSIAAAEAGKFNAFHEALYDGGPVSEASMAAAARTAGLDPAALKAAAANPGTEAQIQTNFAVARQLGMNGTPSWVVGDRVLTGAQTLDQMKQAIAAARERS